MRMSEEKGRKSGAAVRTSEPRRRHRTSIEARKLPKARDRGVSLDPSLGPFPCPFPSPYSVPVPGAREARASISSRMSYDPRTIAFLAEIIYAPMQLRAEQAQGIHNALYRRPETRYLNFAIAQDGIHMSNVPETPGAISMLTLLPDRIVMREELRGTTLEDFAPRLVSVASVCFQSLSIPVSLAQQFVVRSLVSPRHTPDSREFFARKVIAGEPDTWGALGRPLASIGLRLTFPQTDKNKEMFNLRVETWPQDPRSLWIETIGSFTNPVQAENLPELGNYLHATYRFLTGPVSEFLARFDRPS
jgi:hypothetical protein